jgi:hypothetical protein
VANKDVPLCRSVLGRTQPDDVHARYAVGRVLGSGKFGVTRLAVARDSGRHYACNTISKAGLAADEEACVRQELQVMHHVAGERAGLRGRGGGAAAATFSRACRATHRAGRAVAAAARI